MIRFAPFACMAAFALTLIAGSAAAKFVGGSDLRAPDAEEESFGSGMGYFVHSTSKKEIGGNGFVIDRMFAITSAHFFTDRGKWSPEFLSGGQPSFAGTRFRIPICSRTYRVERVVLLTFHAERIPERDIALVQFKDPVCDAARPAPFRSFDPGSLAALQGRQDSLFIIAHNATANWRKRIGFGGMLGFYGGTQGRPYSAITHNVNTDRSISGGAVTANYDQPVVFAVHVGSSGGANRNVAALITPHVENWLRSSIASGTAQPAPIN